MLAATLVALAGSVAPRSSGADPTYPMDLDPIRLGRQAADAGDWAEARRRFDEAMTAGYHVPDAEEGLARVAVIEGRLVDAEALFRKAIEDKRAKDDRDFPAARAGLGLLLLRLDRVAEAGAEFDVALAADPDLWPALYGRGRVLLVAGERDGARELFEKGAKKKSVTADEAMFHHGMALYHLASDRPADAEAEALVAAGLVPGNPEYVRLTAEIYEKRKIPSLAATAYERWLELPGAAPVAPVHRSLGRVYEKLERWNDARDQYVAAVQADSTLAPAWLDLGHLLHRAGQDDRAVLAYRKYLERVPDDAVVHVDLAEALLGLGRPAAALEEASAARALDPAVPRAAGIEIRAGLRSGDKAARIQAAERFAAAPDTLGWTPGDWGALAAAQADLGKTGEAATTFRELVARDPASADAWFQYGVFELNAGRADSARARFERSIALRPDAPLGWLNLGIAEMRDQETRRSIGSFRKALAIDESVPSGRLLLAQALAVSDSLSAAEAEYRSLLSTDPGDARALRGLAYCQIRGRRFAEAAKSYEAATKSEPGNADGWAGLGNAYLGLGRLDASAAAFAKARAIDPDNATLRKGLELLEKARAGGGGG